MVGFYRRIRQRLRGEKSSYVVNSAPVKPMQPFVSRQWPTESKMVADYFVGLDKMSIQGLSPGIYVSDFLTPIGRDAILSELARFNDWQRLSGVVSEANSMHNAAVLGSDLGLNDVILSFGNRILNPLRARLFPEMAPFVSFHAYIVQYGSEWDGDLGFHVDDSDMTLNACLEAADLGSEIIFEGKRCALHVDDSSSSDERFTWEHRQDVAIIHHGKNRHRVVPIEKGQRRNLIIWCQTAEGRAIWEEDWRLARCPQWCDYESKSR